MDQVGTFAWSHAILLIASALLPAVTRALREDVRSFWTLHSGLRLALLGLLSSIGIACDQLANGLDWRSALVGIVVAATPSLCIELVHLFGGGSTSGPSGTGSIDLSREEKKQPSSYSEK
jgi:hypothetical protein